MIALIQRVSEASIEISGITRAAIQRGTLALIGVERGDTERQADRLLERILAYRIFADRAGRMNLDLRETGGSLLLVPQVTLAAETRKGNRAGFDAAAAPAEGKRLFDYLVTRARAGHEQVAAGEFGADMQVHLTNDGPVTFWLRVPPPA